MAAITGLLLAAAATAYSVNESRQAKREGKDAEREMKYQAGQESLKLEDKKKVEEFDIAARANRARQRAMAATQQGYASTINTSPLGLAGNPFGGKDAFGA